jgi:hypothetical protein
MTSGGLPATWGAFCLIQFAARRLDSVPARSSNTLTLKPPSAVLTGNTTRTRAPPDQLLHLAGPPGQLIQQLRVALVMPNDRVHPTPPNTVAGLVPASEQPIVARGNHRANHPRDSHKPCPVASTSRTGQCVGSSLRSTLDPTRIVCVACAVGPMVTLVVPPEAWRFSGGAGQTGPQRCERRHARQDVMVTEE